MAKLSSSHHSRRRVGCEKTSFLPGSKSRGARIGIRSREPNGFRRMPHAALPTLFRAKSSSCLGTCRRNQRVNAIPQAMAEYLGSKLHWLVESSIVQTNVVGHTGADGFSRLARQAEFDGSVSKHTCYILVDDFIGQGGTLANLRGFLLHNGAQVIGGTVLTGKPYSAIVSSDEQQINHLREKHGAELESWWINHFRFGYDCLTRSEARYLLNTPTVERIRDKIAQAIETGNFKTRGKMPPGGLST